MTVGPSVHLIIAGSASHNPDVLTEMQSVATRLGAQLACTAATAAWFDQGRPALPDALAAAVADGATTIIVLPYLLQWSYPDQFSLPAMVMAFAAANPTVHVRLAAPVGLTPAVEAKLAERARAALAGSDIGDLDPAALRAFAQQDPPAVRNPAAPVYPAARQHLLVCGGRPCLDAGSTLLEAGLREVVATAGLTSGPDRVQLTRTRCLGPCRGAAIVAVYPTGDWYHGVTPEQAADLLATVTGRSDALEGQQFRPA